MSTIISSSISNINRVINIPNENNTNNEEDQLNRINLQALQNRDPYIEKIIDQAQRVCVYKFLAEKREWERQDLEGTLFVYERTCEPYHGFVILSTVSRETFVQIIKPSMEFKHSPNYEAFLQYKVDVGDIYGLWFISKNDCPRVTECLKHLTVKTSESEQSKQIHSNSNSDIFSLLTNAQEKFQESKRKQEPINSDNFISMPAALLRIFSTQNNSSQSINNDEREHELKKTLGILGKPALSVTELEKQLLQPSLSLPIVDNPMQTPPHSISPCVMTHPINDWRTSNQNLFNGFDSLTNNDNNGRLMTPSDFQTLRITQSPVLIAPIQIDPTTSSCHCHHSSTNRFSKDILRQLLINMLQTDEDFLTSLHNAYTEKPTDLHRLSF